MAVGFVKLFRVAKRGSIRVMDARISVCRRQVCSVAMSNAVACARTVSHLIRWGQQMCALHSSVEGHTVWSCCTPDSGVRS